jgi:vacuolar-type H+-ATPase subunit I/STV1
MTTFTALTETGERVNFELEYLMQAKWNWGGDVIRLPASEVGAVEVVANTVMTLKEAELQAENEKLFSIFYKAEKTINELQAENARLREALEKLSRRENYYVIDSHGIVENEGRWGMYYTETARQGEFYHPSLIAKNALKGGEG